MRWVDIAAATDPTSPRPPIGGRASRWLLTLISAGLLLGIYTGLGRGASAHRFVAADLHGVVMVLGVVGALVGLAAAARLQRRWAYLGPGLCTVAVPASVAVPSVGGGLLVLAGLVVTAAGLVVTRIGDKAEGTDRSVEIAPVLVVLSGSAWVTATVAWIAGLGPVRITPMLVAFLVSAMVVWQLASATGSSRWSSRWLVASTTVVVAGGAAVIAGWDAGRVLAGVGLIGSGAALWRTDATWRSWRDHGVHGLRARSRSAGQVWLVVGGVLWVALGIGVGGPLLRDAAIHALFIGYGMSIVVGQLPTLLTGPPSATSRAGRRWSAFDGVLGLIHVSITLRVIADLAGSWLGRELALHGTTVALVALIALIVGSVLRQPTIHLDHRVCVDSPMQATSTCSPNFSNDRSADGAWRRIHTRD